MRLFPSASRNFPTGAQRAFPESIGGSGGGGGSSTSYSNPGGTGARSGIITLSTGGPAGGFGFGGTGDINDLIDGTLNDETWFGNNETLKWIRFDFGTAKVIDEFKWYQDNATSQGTWSWEGSNDGTSFTTIGASFTLGGAVICTVARTNSTAYRYYRLIETPGATSNSPFIREIEFKISA